MQLIIFTTFVYLLIIRVCTTGDCISNATVIGYVGETILLPCFPTNFTQVVTVFNWYCTTTTTTTSKKDDICVNGKITNEFKDRFGVSDQQPDNYSLIVFSGRTNDSGSYECSENNGFGPVHCVQLLVLDSSQEPSTSIDVLTTVRFEHTVVTDVLMDTKRYDVENLLKLVVILLSVLIVLVTMHFIYSIMADKLGSCRRSTRNTLRHLSRTTPDGYNSVSLHGDDLELQDSSPGPSTSANVSTTARFEHTVVTDGNYFNWKKILDAIENGVSVEVNRTITNEDMKKLMSDPILRRRCIDILAKRIQTEYRDVDTIVSLDFLQFGSGHLTAFQLEKPSVPIGKFNEVLSEQVELYEVTYEWRHQQSLSMNVSRKACRPRTNVVIVDEFLCTGDSMKALRKLMEKCDVNILGCAVIVDDRTHEEQRGDLGIAVQSLLVVRLLVESPSGDSESKSESPTRISESSPSP